MEGLKELTVDDISANRRLCIDIAEKIFGHTVVETRWGKQKQYASWTIGAPDYYDDAGSMELHNPLPGYCYNIDDAWFVVDKLCQTSTITLTTNHPHYPTTTATEWYCSFDGGDTYADAPTAAMAICKAALALHRGPCEPSQAV